MNKLIKYKNITINNITFLHHISIYFKSFSIKLHLILTDDDNTHPWDFKSLILFGGYRERNRTPSYLPVEEYRKEFHNPFSYYFTDRTYGWLSINRKECENEHHIILRTFLGYKVPTLTIGIYSNKKQLCSLCKDIGYCKSNVITVAKGIGKSNTKQYE